MSPANHESAKLVFEKLSKIPTVKANRFIEGKCPAQANANDCGLYAILIPFCYFMDDKNDNLQDVLTSLTPEKVDKFRKALYLWIKKWAQLSDKQKDSIQSYKDLIKVIGPLVF